MKYGDNVSFRHPLFISHGKCHFRFLFRLIIGGFFSNRMWLFSHVKCVNHLGTHLDSIREDKFHLLTHTHSSGLPVKGVCQRGMSQV